MVRVAVLDDYQGVALTMADWSALPAGTDVHVFRDHLAEEDALVARLREFEVIMAMRERTPFPRSLLQRLPRLRLLATTGMWNAAIDVRAARELGITVCGTRASSGANAEMTWALILAVARKVPQEDRATRAGRWQESIGSKLRGKTLGVLGLGPTGVGVATVGKAFGMTVLAWSQNLTAERAAACGSLLVEKDELLSRSDFVAVCLRLSNRTLGLLGRRELALMKPTAYLVNSARGPIVDEAALVEALQRGAIAGAGLDVFDQEPLPPDHPLLRLENTVITPHLGYVTLDTYEVFYADTIENIIMFLKGQPVRVIDE